MLNCVRAMLGFTQAVFNDEVVELVCTLDDITPEDLAFATQKLLENGALDVYTSSVHMKKHRTGMVLTCMCHTPKREQMLALLFAHTSTLGVREYTCKRYGLTRHVETMQTPLGEIRVKTSQGYGVTRKKIEYDDLASIATTHNLSIASVREKISKLL